jgi:hypothetical protein
MANDGPAALAIDRAARLADDGDIAFALLAALRADVFQTPQPLGRNEATRHAGGADADGSAGGYAATLRLSRLAGLRLPRLTLELSPRLSRELSGHLPLLSARRQLSGPATLARRTGRHVRQSLVWRGLVRQSLARQSLVRGSLVWQLTGNALTRHALAGGSLVWQLTGDALTRHALVGGSLVRQSLTRAGLTWKSLTRQSLARNALHWRRTGAGRRRPRLAGACGLGLVAKLRPTALGRAATLRRIGAGCRRRPRAGWRRVLRIRRRGGIGRSGIGRNRIGNPRTGRRGCGRLAQPSRRFVSLCGGR